MQRLAGRFLVVPVDRHTSWARCYRHQQVSYVQNQHESRYCNFVALGFKKWLPDSFMDIRDTTHKKHRLLTLRQYLHNKLPFIRTFSFPTRFSLMVVEEKGWSESTAVLPQNAAETLHIWQILRSFLVTCPFLLHCAPDTDYGNVDFI
jgi:hypothetical protein